MNPLHQNLLASAATVVYTKTLIGCCDLAVTRRWLATDISRKIIHVGAGSWCLFWPLFSTAHWSWTLNVAVPAVYAVQLVVKGLVLRDPNDSDVKTMSRSGKPIELCQGPLFFTLVMLYCGLYQFRTDVGVYIMGALGYGDGIAPLIGKRYPKYPYPTWGDKQYKTISGSTAMLMATLVGIVVLQSVIGAPARLDLTKLMGVGVTATLAEAVAGKWDNPVIALATWWYCRQN